MATISWTDSIGAATMSNLMPLPADRLADWRPFDASIGPAEASLGLGRINGAKFRRDGLASFEIRAFPGSSLPLALRLKTHLMKGGLVHLSAENVLAERWVDSTLAPGTVPTIQFSDNVEREYTFGVVLRGPTAAVAIGLPLVTSCNLALWLKADSLLGTLSQDAAVNLWPDLSGNGRHASQALGNQCPSFSINTINGHPTVYFNSIRIGNDPALLPICLEFGDVFSATSPSPLTGAEIFIVLRNVLGTPTSDYDSGLWRFGNATTDWTHYPYTDARVYDGFGSLSRYNTGIMPVSSNVPHIYNVTSIAGEWTNRFNGVQLFTSAVNTVSWWVDPAIGRSQNTSTSTIYNYKGFIAELIMYDCKLSDADRLAVLQYLATEYNISVA